MPTTTRVNSLNINLLTQAQFNAAEKDPNQIYMITDAQDNTDISVVTTTENGLMSSADKVKLDGIATGATNVSVDDELSGTSTNPVQNKVINNALNDKANLAISIIANLVATVWIEDGDAHKQILTIDGVTPTRNGVAGVAQTATDEQCRQAASAMLRIAGQGTNQLTIKALGEVPTVDIPLEVILL